MVIFGSCLLHLVFNSKHSIMSKRSSTYSVTILQVNKSLKIQKASKKKVLKVDFVKNLFTSIGNYKEIYWNTGENFYFKKKIQSETENLLVIISIGMSVSCGMKKMNNINIIFNLLFVNMPSPCPRDIAYISLGKYSLIYLSKSPDLWGGWTQVSFWKIPGPG